MKLKGTITEQNLLKAFAGESQARNRYTFFAQTAKEEGYEQIAGIFAETRRSGIGSRTPLLRFSRRRRYAAHQCRIPRGTYRKNARKPVGSSRRRTTRMV